MESKYEQWAESKFEGLSKDELREAGTIFGCHFAPNTSVPTMRIRLCEQVGQAIPANMQPAPEQPKAAAPLPRFKRPNLSATSKWEGRRHNVMIHRPADTPDHKSCGLTWDGETRFFEYGIWNKMPEPYFNVLKQALIKDVRQKAVKDQEGRLTGMESYDVERPRYSYNYSGVDQETAHLPGSILEYWQRQAEKYNYFRDLVGKPAARKALIQIRSDLYGPVGEAFYKDLTNEDIVHSIMQFLGFEDMLYDDLHTALTETKAAA